MNEKRSVRRDDRTTAEPERCAAAWFVTLDAGTADSDTDRKFAEWIGDDIRHEAEFVRCEASMCLADRLRSDPEMRWAYEEIEPLLVGVALAQRRTWPRRWLSASHALAAAAASIVLVILVASVFWILRTDSFPAASQSRPALLGDTLAPEDDQLEKDVSLPSTGPGSRRLDELLELVPSGRAPARFDRFPLHTLVVRPLIVVQPPTSPKSRVVVEMPDGTSGYARVGDYLGEEGVRITEITTTAVVLDEGTRIALEFPRGQ